MATDLSLPPEVVALVCERSGMPWPMVWRTHIARAEPLPVALDADAVALLLRRLAVVMGLSARAVWLEYAGWLLDPDGRDGWHVLTEDSEQNCCAPGIPEHVTCPDCGGSGDAFEVIDGLEYLLDCEGCGGAGRQHVTDPIEAAAWAVCWWAMVQKLAIVLGTRPDGATEDWRVLARLAESFDLPLWTPLRDGVAMEVPDGE